MELGHEVESHTALLFPLRRLVGDLCTFLSIRDGGVQRFVLRLEHEVVKCAGLGGTGAAATRREDSVAYTEVEVGLLAAEREPAMLFELARSRLERVSIPAPVVALRLLARQLPPFVPASRDLFDSRHQQQLPWPQLRERLRARLGGEAVYRVAPADDPRPERAWQRLQGDGARIETAPARPPRPPWLLPRPLPLRGEVRIEQLNPKNVLIDADADEYDPDKWGDVIITKWMSPDQIEMLYSKADADLLRGRQELVPAGLAAWATWR